uniref:Uncharacterized protein LOC114340676 n=1 Tax=Diabrotica virgifera virgifera TaxID=50390 RepID=A0A6P7GPX4_DIAVI
MERKERRNNIIITRFENARGTIFIISTSTKPAIVQNQTFPFDEAFPFDLTQEPFYEIIFSLQVTCLSTSIFVITVGVDLLVLGILLITGYQYYLLGLCFGQMNSDKMMEFNNSLRRHCQDKLEEIYKDELKEYFVRCVRHHQMLLR